jgi:hypothetical protein
MPEPMPFKIRNHRFHIMRDNFQLGILVKNPLQCKTSKDVPLADTCRSKKFHHLVNHGFRLFYAG